MIVPADSEGSTAPAGRACLEIRPREWSPGSPGAVSAHGDSAAHAHGRRPPDLCSDGHDERGLHARDGGHGGRGSSSIIALDWNTQGKLLWELQVNQRSISPTGRRTESASIGRSSSRGRRSPNGRNVYVAVTDRRETTATYIACLDADTGAAAGFATWGPRRPTAST